MKAVAKASCASSSGAPIAKRNRIPGGTPASAALNDGLQSTRPSVPMATISAAIAGAMSVVVNAATAVKATIAATLARLVALTPDHHLGRKTSVPPGISRGYVLKCGLPA